MRAIAKKDVDERKNYANFNAERFKLKQVVNYNFIAGNMNMVLRKSFCFIWIKEWFSHASHYEKMVDYYSL